MIDNLIEYLVVGVFQLLAVLIVGGGILALLSAAFGHPWW